MKILTILLPLLALSCASQRREAPIVKKVSKTSEQLQRERIIDHYHLLREQNQTRRKSKSFEKLYRPKRKVIPKIARVDPAEQKIELDQHLSYFCMKHRKEQRFKDGASCKNFTSKLLAYCLEKLSWGEKGIIKCARLRLR